MKRIISLVLSILFCFSLLAVPVSANEIHATADVNLQERSIQIQKSIPDANITIENNTIHVVVNSVLDIPGYSTYASSSLPVSYDGGSYRNFSNVILADYYPYSQVYMNEKVAAAFNFYLDNPDEFRQALEKTLEHASALVIESIIRTKFEEERGKPLTDGDEQEIEYIVEGLSAFVSTTIIQLAKSSFKSAYTSSNNGRVCVVRGYTADGYHVIYYSAWNDYYVPSYNAYPADWYEGIYDVSTY